MPQRHASDPRPFRRRAAAALASVLTAAALVVAVPSAPASAVDESDFAVSVSGAYGDASYTPDNATASMSQSNQGAQQVLSVSVASTTDDSSLSFDFQSRDGSNAYLDVGSYGDAQQYPFTDPGRPGLSLSPLGFCNEQSGNFEVRDIRHDGLAVTAVWITFQRYCDDADPVFGEIRIGYPAAPAEVSPQVVRWPRNITPPGRAGHDVPVRVRSGSATPPDVGAVSVVGPHAADFPVRSNGCTGILDATGCVVTVGFTPHAPGPRHARLKVSTTQGDRYVSLDGDGALGTTAWVLDVDYEDVTRTDEHVDMPHAAAAGSPYAVHAQGFQSDDGTIWDLSLSPPAGETFAPGHYAYRADGTGLRISFARGNAACEIDRADVDVDAIAFSGPDDDLSLLDLRLDVHCRSASGNTTSGRVTFHARDDVTAPAAPAGLTGQRSADGVSLTWQHPGDADLAGVLVRWYDGSTAPAATDLGTFGYFGAGDSVSFPAPDDGPVTVSVQACDTAGNTSAPSTVTLQP